MNRRQFHISYIRNKITLCFFFYSFPFLIEKKERSGFLFFASGFAIGYFPSMFFFYPFWFYFWYVETFLFSHTFQLSRMRCCCFFFNEFVVTFIYSNEMHISVGNEDLSIVYKSKNGFGSFFFMTADWLINRLIDCKGGIFVDQVKRNSVMAFVSPTNV